MALWHFGMAPDGIELAAPRFGVRFREFGRGREDGENRCDSVSPRPSETENTQKAGPGDDALDRR
jgi:hypothetical protein